MSNELTAVPKFYYTPGFTGRPFICKSLDENLSGRKDITSKFQ